MMLYHYTCKHRRAVIAATSLIIPYPQPALGGREAIWLTDTKLSTPMTVKARRAIGVDHEKYECDKSEHCIVVHPTSSGPDFETPAQLHLWSVLAFDYPGQYALTEAPLGARPDTWWLSFEPLKVLVPELKEPKND